MKEDDDVVAVNKQILQPTVRVEISLETMRIFRQYLESKYHDEEDVVAKKLEELDNIFRLGIEHLRRPEFENKPLLFDEKKTRKDVLINLALIASEFLKLYSYPEIQSNEISIATNKILGDKDERTIRKYKKNVLQLCNISETYAEKASKSKISALGIINVSGFVNRIPKELLNTTSSTSFSKSDEDDYGKQISIQW